MSKEAVDRLHEKAQNEQTAIALNDLCRTQRDRIVDLERELAHWKANHSGMVQRKAILEQRPDLPVDRIPAIQALDAEKAKVAELERQVAELRTDAERWQRWLPWLRNLDRKPFNLAKEIMQIDAALAQAKQEGA